MTPEQKQRAQNALWFWQGSKNDHEAQLAGGKMAALLQELIDAPEPEPFGYFKAEPLGWTDCAETDDGAIALYELPPAQSVPDGWRGLTDVEWMNVVNFDRAYSSYDKEGAVNEAVKRTEAKLKELNAAQQPEPPADQVRDAEPWKLLLENLVEGLNKTHWSSWQGTAHFDEYLQEAISAIERDKMKGQS